MHLKLKSWEKILNALGKQMFLFETVRSKLVSGIEISSLKQSFKFKCCK